AGRAWIERHNFRRCSENVNLRVPLVANPKVTADRALAHDDRARVAGYEVRRVGKRERDLLVKMAQSAFAPAWAYEVGRAMDQDPPAVWAAWKDGQPVAFAAHDANNS